ncbi:hypothetical protein PsorP6_001842 [Peronosclerospora sorghi]|uniref:Uncharacterized protein n=1 Tax=Peronosclerospora sorghi TaxID=230839 RepID=A0ACC0WQX7_9STRA|nr:hypothetical protein PsorP6_001842 [Peronosclerospora sorghi]
MRALVQVEATRSWPSFGHMTRRARISTQHWTELTILSRPAPTFMSNGWTHRLLATWWTFALERSYKVRNETPDATGFMRGSLFDGTKATSEEGHGREVVSLDPVDAVVQFDHWSTHDKDKGFPPTIDRVASEPTPSCPGADHEVAKPSNEDARIVLATIQRGGQDECKAREHSRFQRGWEKRSTRWINVGYGRYVKVEEK